MFRLHRPYRGLQGSPIFGGGRWKDCVYALNNKDESLLQVDLILRWKRRTRSSERGYCVVAAAVQILQGVLRKTQRPAAEMLSQIKLLEKRNPASHRGKWNCRLHRSTPSTVTAWNVTKTVQKWRSWPKVWYSLPFGFGLSVTSFSVCLACSLRCRIITPRSFLRFVSDVLREKHAEQWLGDKVR